MYHQKTIYQTLQKHLDKMPVGYPATRSGVELRILERLFTPEEARLAIYMTHRFQSAEEISQRA
ncbi:MAG TPA: 4Fe-4S ferredoxin, partial [Desulfosalsimonadaceae bacterium]|nr:4Fe-4S ferredoxin [Desulfosalsimonadaceae bacterium]